MAKVVSTRVNSINFVFQAHTSGLRDSDLAAADIKSLPLDERMNRSTAWMEQSVSKPSKRRRYVRGYKIYAGKDTSNV